MTKVVKERRSDFLNFDKTEQRLDQFLMRNISDTKEFIELKKCGRYYLSCHMVKPKLNVVLASTKSY